MTDREMLELAAKAAGLPDMRTWTWVDIDTYGWNPLTDPGDALRLAVALGIHITNSETDAWATTAAVTSIQPIGSDPLAATCRAITRAAAEVGKGME